MNFNNIFNNILKKMLSNKVLSVIIVLILILSFISWLIISGMLLFSGNVGAGLAVFIPGAIFFGFWGLVIKRLYECPTKD